MTYHELHEAIMKASNKKHMNYVFLDEVQEVDNFEKAIISLFENEDYKFDIYITGSNSKMFSEELASLFTNRYIRIKCYPFSFKEYLEFADSTGDLQKRGRYEVFEDFLKYGSLPTIFEV
jgi:predicted AAA+ superfamily ATPase